MNKITQLLQRIYLKRYSLLLAPFYIPFAPLLYIVGVRLIKLHHNKIGHLLVEPEIYLKKRALGQEPWRYTFIFAPNKTVANTHFLHYLNAQPKLGTISSSIACFLMDPFWLFKFLRIKTNDYGGAYNKTSEWATVSAQWVNRPPVMKISEEDLAAGKMGLAKLGIPKNAWFVCFHVREGGFSPSDENVHSFRNADIRNFFPAMDEVVKKGGWCIRMGDPTMTKLGEMKGVIDYAHSPYRSAQLDIVLPGICRFFLGTASGLSNVAAIFGVPLGITNLAPISMALPLSIIDTGMVKLYFSKERNRLLSFKEICDSDASNFRLTPHFTEAGIELLENTADEIEGMCKEMMLTTDENNSIEYTDEENELQAKFKSLFRPGHFTYGAPGRISKYFLEKHCTLLN